MNWTDLSVGVASLLALVYCVRTVRGIALDNQKFLGNHMSGITKSMQEVATNLAVQNEKIDAGFKRLHDDNLTISRQLRQGVPTKEPVSRKG